MQAFPTRERFADANRVAHIMDQPWTSSVQDLTALPQQAAMAACSEELVSSIITA